jgi:uncharacterized protein YdaU (DUF1376 family)
VRRDLLDQHEVPRLRRVHAPHRPQALTARALKEDPVTDILSAPAIKAVAAVNQRVYTCGQTGCYRPAAMIPGYTASHTATLDPADMKAGHSGELDRVRFCAVHAGARKRARYGRIDEWVTLDAPEAGAYLTVLAAAYRAEALVRAEADRVEKARRDSIYRRYALANWAEADALWEAQYLPERDDPNWKGQRLPEEFVIVREDGTKESDWDVARVLMEETKGDGPILIKIERSSQSMSPSKALALGEALIRAAGLAEARNRRLQRPVQDEKEVTA